MSLDHQQFIWSGQPPSRLIDSIVFPNPLQIIVEPFVGFIYIAFNRRVRRPFNGSVYEYLGLAFLLLKYFNMQCLKSRIWNGETILNPAYKVTLVASLNREGFGSAIIPVGQIGHLAPRIDLPSFGQYSIWVDVVTRLKCAGKMMMEIEIVLLTLAELSWNSLGMKSDFGRAN